MSEIAPIVVGVDGSHESAAALRWADGFALAAGRPLRIVTAVQAPAGAGDSAGAYLESFDAVEAIARSRAAEKVLERVLGPGWRERAVHVVQAGSVSGVLADRHRDAATIVLGTRRTDGLIAKLRGSVTNRLTGAVTCPVVSVPLAAMAEPAAA